jgi:hypothetical protein
MCLLSTGEDTQLTLQVESGETELPLPPRRNDPSRECRTSASSPQGVSPRWE